MRAGSLAAGWLCVGVILSNAQADAQSIHQRVADSHGAPVKLLVREDAHSLSVDELAGADLVVVGKLLRRQSYLDPSDAYILTDYELLPSRIISHQTTTTRATPGNTTPLVVTLKGGEVTVDGVKVVMINDNQVDWPEGAELLLFLSRHSDNKYGTYGGPSGMFVIDSDQRLKVLRRRADPNPEIDNMSVTALVQQIQQAMKQRK